MATRGSPTINQSTSGNLGAGLLVWRGRCRLVSFGLGASLLANRLAGLTGNYLIGDPVFFNHIVLRTHENVGEHDDVANIGTAMCTR